MIVGKIPTAWAGWDWENNDPDFAQVLHRIQECHQTNSAMV